jgi:hypothetical protein
MRPIAGNDRPILISPRGSVVEALSVCGKGLQRTAWEPLADFRGAEFIACATCSGTCNVAYLPSRLAPISWKSLLLVFKNEYLATATHAHGSAMMRRKLALSIANRARRQAPNAPQSCSRRLTQTRENVGECYWRGRVVRESEMPVRGQCCGDSSQAAEEPMSALAGSFQ